MAEYYPLLAKAVGSIPNSTPETRRIVYERARKALIGQLRTLHPPVPEEDIEHESVELDRAVERIEAELAAGGLPAPPPPAPPPVEPAPLPVSPKPESAPRPPAPAARDNPPFAPLKTKLPKPKTPPIAPEPPPALAEEAVPSTLPEPQRPIAPQPPHAATPKRKLWIIPAGIGGLAAIVALVGFAAWHFRDTRETVRAKPVEQAQTESGKIAERVGGTGAPAPDAGTPQTQPAASPKTEAQAPAVPQNPELPIASRAALLVEAPDEKSKVKTFLGTVVWKLNNVSVGPNEPVGLAVEADVDMPDARLKAVVIFEKNTDPSLPASHTVKVRFVMQPGSFTGDVKEIDVPQMRPEEVPNGEPLSGATTPVLQNSFLVGLSPGNAETANMKVLQELQWIDIPMRLTNGRIAKLTFEKGEAGQRDLNEAITAWAKG